MTLTHNELQKNITEMLEEVTHDVNGKPTREPKI